MRSPDNSYRDTMVETCFDMPKNPIPGDSCFIDKCERLFVCCNYEIGPTWELASGDPTDDCHSGVCPMDHLIAQLARRYA